ncbi:hypothetical protein [Flectobacillus major]|uniref:hypothetical protein n=1 Tax=Flectobacillus major TaxID=103 RepID=UPI0004165B74|nr:hypothetical protein [Flectobacillus major]
MLLHIKKTRDKTYLIDGNPYFISGLGCFIVTFLLGLIVRKGLDKAFLNATGLTILVTLIIYVFDQAGKKKHRKILSSKLFQYLLAAGFEVEEQSKYMGLIGEINQTTFRVYYDWNKLSKGFFSFGDVVIISYFEPLISNFDTRTVDEEHLEDLNRKYKETFWTSKRIFARFAPTFFIRHLNYYPFMKTETVLSELDKISNLIKESGLTPLSKKMLEERQKEFGYNYAPPIETFELEQVE